MHFAILNRVRNKLLTKLWRSVHDICSKVERGGDKWTILLKHEVFIIFQLCSLKSGEENLKPGELSCEESALASLCESISTNPPSLRRATSRSASCASIWAAIGTLLAITTCETPIRIPWPSPRTMGCSNGELSLVWSIARHRSEPIAILYPFTMAMFNGFWFIQFQLSSSNLETDKGMMTSRCNFYYRMTDFTTRFDETRGDWHHRESKNVICRLLHKLQDSTVNESSANSQRKCSAGPAPGPLVRKRHAPATKVGRHCARNSDGCSRMSWCIYTLSQRITFTPSLTHLSDGTFLLTGQLQATWAACNSRVGNREVTRRHIFAVIQAQDKRDARKSPSTAAVLATVTTSSRAPAMIRTARVWGGSRRVTRCKDLLLENPAYLSGSRYVWTKCQWYRCKKRVNASSNHRGRLKRDIERWLYDSHQEGTRL